MSIVLFAMIGAMLKAGAAYWIIYGIFCAFKVGKAVADTIKEMDN